MDNFFWNMAGGGIFVFLFFAGWALVTWANSKSEKEEDE
jgi:hypothetical protein